MASGSETINNHASFIWSVADLLRGDYKQSEYGRVILPFTVLRRLAPVARLSLAEAEQIALLVEHRQALMTAAVTGELEVPGVAA